MSKRDLRPEDVELWHRVARHIKALPGKVAPRPAGAVFLPASPKQPPRMPLNHDIPKAGPAKPAFFNGPVADRGTERRVRRGQIEIAAKLDLHGFHQDGARQALEAFVQRSAAQGARAVLVVTGKGTRRGVGEPQAGVLRSQTPIWLAAPDLRAVVAGYASAHAKHGGEGAYYVFLRRQSATRP